MWQWLRALQQKPLAYRKNAAFVGAFLITAVVTTVWATTLPERFAMLSGPSPTVIERDPALTRLFGGVRTQMGAVRAAFGELAEPPATTVATSSTNERGDTPIPQWVAKATSTPTSTITSSSTTKKRHARPILIATSSAAVE